MMDLSVEPFLFEVAKGLDYKVRQRKQDIKSFGRVRRMCAALATLGATGFAEYDSEEARWKPSIMAFEAMELAKFKLDASALALAVAEPQFFYLLSVEPSWTLPDQRVSKLFQNELDVDEVKSLWKAAGIIFGGLVRNELRLTGLAESGGLIIDSVSEAMKEECGDTCTFSLAHEGKSHVVMLNIDLPPLTQPNVLRLHAVGVKWPY